MFNLTEHFDDTPATDHRFSPFTIGFVVAGFVFLGPHPRAHGGTPTATLSCTLSTAPVTPAGQVSVDVFLRDAIGVRGFQAALGITPISGGGEAALVCPGGVLVDPSRSDFIFDGLDTESLDPGCANCGAVMTDCQGGRAVAALLSGSVDVGSSNVHLATFALDVSGNAAPGSIVRILPFPNSILGDVNNQSIPFAIDPSCEITLAGTSCPASSPPVAVEILAEVGETETVDLATNRMIALTAGDPGQTQVIRITLVDLPGSFAGWNGTEMWVTEPQDVCSLPGVSDPAACGSAPLFKIASLSCDPVQAHEADWSLVGEFYVQHPGIVPDGLYDVQVADSQCDLASSASFSPALAVRNSIFGDITGGFDPGAVVWVAPDGVVGIPTDILSMIAGFGNQPGSPTKTRADVEPCVLDFKINIIDIVRALDGFRGLPYPFAPGQLDCPLDPCVTDGTVSEASSARQTISARAALRQALAKRSNARLANLTLVPSSTHAALGETVSVDVFAEGLVDLRSYQVTLAIDDGLLASRERAALHVDERRADYVFAGRDSLSAVDHGGLRLAGALVNGAVDAEGRVYLGTFSFRVPQQATSSLTVGVATDDGASRFTDSADRVLPFEAEPTTITMSKRSR